MFPFFFFFFFFDEFFSWEGILENFPGLTCEDLDEADVAVDTGEVHGRVAVVVLHVRVAAQAQQYVGRQRIS